MRSIDLSKPLNRLARALTSVSVRTRIVVLALVPVVGFLANGMTYVSGKRDVDGAFRSVGNSHALADASRDFKIAVDGMRIAVKDFTASAARRTGRHFRAVAGRRRTEASIPSKPPSAT